MEVGQRHSEFVGRSADLVERQQRTVTIERRVLQPFRHDWPGQLLKAHDEQPALGTVGVADAVRIFEQ